MKQIILSLITICSAFVATAQSCVTTKQLGADYATQTVTFALTWNSCNDTTNHNKVWCFIDFREADNSFWTRAAISTPAAVSNGTCTAGNAYGFYITGKNGQSATVTVKLDNVPDKFDWCAFAGDYPPQVSAAAGNVVFEGTPPFYVTYKEGGSDTFTVTTATVPSGKTIASFTDATNCPGVGKSLPCTGTPFYFGTVSFVPGPEVTISSNGINQVWSQPVVAGGCQKNNYSSYYYPHPEQDCVNGWLGQGESQFTWCAVVNNQSLLCPSPWRVPSVTDFRNLDIALGGSGTYHKLTAAQISNWYVGESSIWKGAFRDKIIGNYNYNCENGCWWAIYATNTVLPNYPGGSYMFTVFDNGWVLFGEWGWDQHSALPLRCVK